MANTDNIDLIISRILDEARISTGRLACALAAQPGFALDRDITRGYAATALQQLARDLWNIPCAPALPPASPPPKKLKRLRRGPAPY